MTTRDYPVTMTLSVMRSLGVRSLEIECPNPNCQRKVVLNVDAYPGDLLIGSFAPRMLCGKCRIVGAKVRPSWTANFRHRAQRGRSRAIAPSTLTPKLPNC